MYSKQAMKLKEDAIADFLTKIKPIWDAEELARRGRIETLNTFHPLGGCPFLTIPGQVDYLEYFSWDGKRVLEFKESYHDGNWKVEVNHLDNT